MVPCLGPVLGPHPCVTCCGSTDTEEVRVDVFVELVHVTLDGTQHGITCPISLSFYICFYQHKLSCI
jgi:hypothetical protein